MRDAGQIADADLDREIADALAVDPSPEFLARIRQRLRDEQPSSPWPLAWMAAAAAGIVAVGIALAMNGHGRRDAPLLVAHPISTDRTNKIVPLVAAGASRLDELRQPIAPTAPRAASADAPAAGAEVPVLVDPREARAIRSLITDVRSGRIDLTPLLNASAPAFLDGNPVRKIDIAPIDLSPLPGSGNTDTGVPQ